MELDVIYLVGRFRAKTEHGPVWDIVGIFSDEDQAIFGAVNLYDFIAEIQIDRVLDDSWIGKVYYPNLMVNVL